MLKSRLLGAVGIVAVIGGVLAAQGGERDILAIVAEHPLGVTVDGRPAKYGDPDLETAVNGLPEIPMPWTVPQMVAIYEQEREAWLQQLQHVLDIRSNRMWPTWQREADRCGYLARVLAASRDARAAIALGATLDATSQSEGGGLIRFSAERGLFEYFVRDMDYGLPPQQRHLIPRAGNFLTEEGAAVERWWAANKDALKTQALAMPPDRR